MSFSIAKYKNNPVLLGTFWLTLSGLLCKSMGFFYRIFLSRTIGAEGLGVYQLAMPFFVLLLALCSTAISTGVTRLVSYDSKYASGYLVIALFISTVLCLLLGSILYLFSDYIANTWLKEERCGFLLRIIALTIFPCAWHNCINGYCFGRKKTMVPASSQFLEQFCRILIMLLLYQYCKKNNLPFEIKHVGIGLLAGELAGFITVYHVFYKMRKPKFWKIDKSHYQSFFHIVIPLSTNQLLMNLFSSLELILIPNMLVLYGYPKEEALQVFGVFTGMALSLIFAPSVLIHSLAVMLLPEVSEASKACNLKRIFSLIHKVLWFGLIFGIVCGVFFYVFRISFANNIFKNALVEGYLQRLCFLCPLLYIESLLHSFLNGQCYSRELLVFNLISCSLRILVILFGIPRLGMDVYILGLIAGSALNITLSLLYLAKKKGPSS